MLMHLQSRGGPRPQRIGLLCSWVGRMVAAGVVPIAIGSAQAPPRTGELTTSAIARRATPATVTIIALGRNRDTLALGSGFLVRSNGVVLTNWHVIRDAYSAVVVLSDGTQVEPVLFVAADRSADIAVLRIPGAHHATIQIEPAVPQIGSRVVIVSSPLGLSTTVSEGIVSARRVLSDREFIQVTAPISPGSSGAPILNSHGAAFAIASATIEAGQALNFGVPIRSAEPLLAAVAIVVPLSEVTDWRSADGKALPVTNAVSVYEGSVANNTLPEWPASLRIEITGWDPSPHGYLTVGSPLGGSGPVTVGWVGDSVMMITISETADTILWLGGYRREALSGPYRIIGGPWSGQSGTWAATLRSGPPLPARRRRP